MTAIDHDRNVQIASDYLDTVRVIAGKEHLSSTLPTSMPIALSLGELVRRYVEWIERLDGL